MKFSDTERKVGEENLIFAFSNSKVVSLNEDYAVGDIIQNWRLEILRDTYYETGDPARLPAQVAGLWGQRN